MTRCSCQPSGICDECLKRQIRLAELAGNERRQDYRDIHGKKGMTLDQFHAVKGLSYSALKDLAISPLRYWHLHLNPNAPEKRETPEMIFGRALHCRVLEPQKFGERYARAFVPPEGCLSTMDDLRAWLTGHGAKAKGTRKADLIWEVQHLDPDAKIADVLREQHARETEGRVLLSPDDWDRVQGAAASLLSEPRIQEVLADGQAEVPMMACDPEHNVLLKAIMDWVTPKVTLELKTFTQKRGRSIDQSITDALYYEGYLKQAVFYSMVRGWPEKWNGDTLFAFVESDAPFEVRLRTLRPTSFGQPNLCWQRPLMEIRSLIRLYADCLNTFGDKPWRTPCSADVLMDEEIRQLAWA